jgi:hypothetical protein
MYMRISVRRTGGYTGMIEDLINIDTTHLPTSSARRIEEIIEELEFFKLPSVVTGRKFRIDFSLYGITITENYRQHAVSFSDDGTKETARLKNLIDTLKQVSI